MNRLSNLKAMKPKINNRITLDDDLQTAMIKISEGNPGALHVCLECFKRTLEIDPDALGGVGTILSFDSYGIYGSDIWILYKDICKESIPNLLAVLRAVQLDFLSESKLRLAIDNYQDDSLKVPELVAQVKERLPNFGSKLIENVFD